jgi:hypothetical protein
MLAIARCGSRLPAQKRVKTMSKSRKTEKTQAKYTDEPALGALADYDQGLISSILFAQRSGFKLEQVTAMLGVFNLAPDVRRQINDIAGPLVRRCVKRYGWHHQCLNLLKVVESAGAPFEIADAFTLSPDQWDVRPAAAGAA